MGWFSDPPLVSEPRSMALRAVAHTLPKVLVSRADAHEKAHLSKCIKTVSETNSEKHRLKPVLSHQILSQWGESLKRYHSRPTSPVKTNFKNKESMLHVSLEKNPSLHSHDLQDVIAHPYTRCRPDASSIHPLGTCWALRARVCSYVWGVGDTLLKELLSLSITCRDCIFRCGTSWLE